MENIEIESTATLYALSVKGGYYDDSGEITELLAEAKLFSTQQEAIEFRRIYDPLHHIERASILQLTVFISQTED